MSTRAKFKVQKIERTLGSRKTDSGGYEPVEFQTIILHPVFPRPDQPYHENNRFWSASPSGEFRLGTINPEAWEVFELSGEYYIDITPASDD